MAFTMESIDNSIASVNPVSDIQIKDGPVFTGYDPRGTTTVTGSERVIPQSQPENLKQETINESPPEESVKLSSKISALARREQIVRQKELQLKRAQQENSGKLQDADKFAQIREKLKNKDYSAAEELGMTYDEYTQHLLNKQASEDPQEMRHRELQEKLERLEKAQEEQTVREYEANQKLWVADIARVVSESQDFPTIKELGAEEAVLKHINDSFNEDGVELTTEEACKEIEELLVQRVEKYSNLSVIKKKYEDSRSLGPPKTGPKTITQQMTVTSQKPVVKPFHLMSESEQLAEAIRRVQAEKLQQR